MKLKNNIPRQKRILQFLFTFICRGLPDKIHPHPLNTQPVSCCVDLDAANRDGMRFWNPDITKT
jgi:hypothetical protein